MLARAAVVVALSLLAGCGAAQVRGERVTDAELLEDGLWTPDDALARALLDLEAPPHLDGEYPTRLRPRPRAFFAEVRVGGLVLPIPRVTAALEALLGLGYERQYQYVAAARAYVLVHRGRPPTIVGEDADHGPVSPPTDPAAFRELQAELARDVETLREAAERAAAALGASP